jgi:hypothetical protein
MDEPAQFTNHLDGMKKVEAMTPSDHYVRKLAKLRGAERKEARIEYVPSLPDTFFGPKPANVSLPNFGSVSIKQQRSMEKSLGDKRAEQLARRRKITTSSEKYKFF